jgi:hypothetical protein
MFDVFNNAFSENIDEEYGSINPNNYIATIAVNKLYQPKPYES